MLSNSPKKGVCAAMLTDFLPGTLAGYPKSDSASTQQWNALPMNLLCFLPPAGLRPINAAVISIVEAHL
jgi:hypothetical protein